MFVSSFLGSSATSESAVASRASEPTTVNPASESTLASVGDFLSGLVTGKPKTYATPQEVFDAYWRAKDGNDMRELLGTIAPDQQELILAEVIRQLAVARQSLPAVTKGIETYGLDFETISTSNTTSGWRELAAKVKNPGKFFEVASDRLKEAREQIAKAQLEEFKKMAEAARQSRSGTELAAPPGMDPSQPRGPRSRRQLTPEQREQFEQARKEMEQPPRLEELAITDDGAKGMSVRGGEVFRISSPVTFVKIGESWYINDIGM